LHFSVLVITDEHPTEAVIRLALQPFRQEPASEYIQDIDVTESAQERFLIASGTRLEAPDGSLHDAFEERFYREPTLEEDVSIMASGAMEGALDGVRYSIKSWADGFLSGKVRFVPDGWREVPNQNGHNQTLAEFASDYHGIGVVSSGDGIDRDVEHYNGFVVVDEDGNVKRVVTRGNPDARYDYFLAPGGFNGELRHLGGSDVCRRSDLKLEEAVAKFAADRLTWANKMVVQFGLSGLDQLGDTVAAILTLREGWMAESAPKAQFFEWLKQRNADYASNLAAMEELPGLEAGQSLEHWIENPEPLWAYAIVKDGIWHEGGKNPWWRPLVDRNIWHHEAWRIIRDLPSDKWIAIVDCHN
jgi:hypothetical protein